MRRYNGQALDQNGNPVAGASVYVYIEGTTTLATLWANASRTVTAPNPLTTDSYGRFGAFMDDGRYDIKIVKAGVIDITIPNVTVVDPFPLTQVVRETATHWYWDLSNAVYDPGSDGFVRQDTTKPASAWRSPKANPGVRELVVAGAGTGLITWSVMLSLNDTGVVSFVQTPQVGTHTIWHDGNTALRVGPTELRMNVGLVSSTSGSGTLIFDVHRFALGSPLMYVGTEQRRRWRLQEKQVANGYSYETYIGVHPGMATGTTFTLYWDYIY